MPGTSSGGGQRGQLLENTVEQKRTKREGGKRELKEGVINMGITRAVLVPRRAQTSPDSKILIPIVNSFIWAMACCSGMLGKESKKGKESLAREATREKKGTKLVRGVRGKEYAWEHEKLSRGIPSTVVL